MDHGEAWEALPLPWREAYDLAWESFRSGSPPIGAVVTNDTGHVIARGRSRRGENVAPGGQLAGNYLAHAEVNALAGITARPAASYALYVTLQPCFLCTAAVVMAHLPIVHYAGRDPVWDFLSDLPANHPVLKERWFALEGPLPGPVGSFSALLTVADLLSRSPGSGALCAYRQQMPQLVAVAENLLTRTSRARMARQTLEEIYADVAPDLDSLDNR